MVGLTTIGISGRDRPLKGRRPPPLVANSSGSGIHSLDLGSHSSSLLT